MRKITVLGGGLVGSLIAKQLARDPGISVVVADIAIKSFPTQSNLDFLNYNLAAAGGVEAAIKDAEVVIVALPGRMGQEAVKKSIQCGKHVVDISFSPEDPFDLDDLACARRVSVLTDCGVAPGLSNFFVGLASMELDEITDINIYVGGLPLRRTWPFEYRLVFSLTDVIEEYTRPSRYRENRVIVTRPALSDPELIDFGRVGTLEAFNTDGLRTLLTTYEDIPNVKEKTLRYPGHIEKMRVFRDAGFFDRKPIEVSGQRVSPREFTESLFKDAWKLPEGDNEFTFLQVKVEGLKDTVKSEVTWELYDETDRATRDTSMARTTGFPAVVATRMILCGIWDDVGVKPLEFMGSELVPSMYMLDNLKLLGIQIKREYRETD